MKYLYSLLLLLYGQLSAQSLINYGEYFIDFDPGYGLASPFPSFSPDSLIEPAFDLDIDTLSQGLHHLYVRVQNEQGIWSHTIRRSFMVVSPDPRPLTYLEWFWDQDPGYGNAYSVPINPADSLSQSWSVNIDSLSPGIHHLYCRVRISTGQWSQTIRRTTILKSLPDAPLEYLEYTFSDTLSYTYFLAQPQHYIDLSFDANVSDLLDGKSYQLCVAAVNTDGQKSFKVCRTMNWAGDTTTHIQDAPQNALVRLYPNPSDGLVHIESPFPQMPLHLRIINMQGQLVFEQQLESLGGTYQELNLSNFPAGTYLVFMESGHKLHTQKLQLY